MIEHSSPAQALAYEHNEIPRSPVNKTRHQEFAAIQSRPQKSEIIQAMGGLSGELPRAMARAGEAVRENISLRTSSLKEAVIG